MQASKQASNRYAWLDTVRVLAAALVLISHYAYYFNFERLQVVNNYFAGSTGRIGVCLFFAISGYLVSNSLVKNNNLLAFYKSKAVRILLPYIAAYILVSALFISLAFFRPDFINLTPMTKVLFVGGDYKALFLGMLPLDIYFYTYLDLKGYWFIGEWFIGTLVSLYIIAPLVFWLAKKIPFVTMVIFLGISIAIYNASANLPIHGFWFSLVRLPEFYLGTLLYLYKENFTNKKVILTCVGMVIISFIIGVMQYNNMFIADRFIPLEPRSFIFSLPLIIVTFYTCEKLNKKYNIAIFNSYSKISYVFMLIQHIVINTFMWNFDEHNFSKFGVLVFLIIIFVVTIYLAKKITDFYKPIEELILKKKGSTKNCS